MECHIRDGCITSSETSVVATTITRWRYPYLSSSTSFYSTGAGRPPCRDQNNTSQATARDKGKAPRGCRPGIDGVDKWAA